MMSPLWRKAYDAIERPLTAGSEAWVQSDTFMDMTAIAFRVQRRMLGELHQTTERWLHLWGWPSQGDVVRLTNQVASLERQIRELRDPTGRNERPPLNGHKSRGRSPTRPRARQSSSEAGS